MRLMEKWIILLFCLVLPVKALAEVSYPPARNTVGNGEYYEHSQLGEWSIECLRERDGSDYCTVYRRLTDLSAGLALEFSVTPLLDWTVPVEADVDVFPRALIDMVALSEAEHYDDLITEITSVDDQPFDGFRCPVDGDIDCERGPDLTEYDVRSLMSGERMLARVENGVTGDVISELSISLENLASAYQIARLFNAESVGIDLDHPENIWEVCSFHHDGDQRRITYLLDEEASYSQPSIREMIRGTRGETDCPSYVILSYMTPEMTPPQRGLFCLIPSDDGSGYLGVELGERNAYNICRAPDRAVCERVNAARDEVIAIGAAAGAALSASVGAATASSAAGTSVVLHSSGAAIITGSSGYIAGTLGATGTTALAVLTAPATLTAAAVTVVAAGGAVYICGG